MADTPQLSGRDLARQALAAYKATAHTTPATGPATRKRKKRTATYTNGRDPISLAAALTALGADIPLEAGVAGGSVIDQWPTLCPQYVGLVQPVHYDDTSGRLDLRPGSHSYAAQLRLLGGQLAKQINDKLGRPVVRTIRVLPVGAIDTPTAGAAEQRPQGEAPVRTREDGCPGYRDAMAVVLEHRPERPPVDPYIAEAMARQEAALRAGRQPGPAPVDLARESGPVAGSVEESLRRARAYARQQRAGHTPRRAFDVA